MPSKPPEQAFSSSQAVLAPVRSHKRNPYDGDDGDDGGDDDDDDDDDDDGDDGDDGDGHKMSIK